MAPRVAVHLYPRVLKCGDSVKVRIPTQFLFCFFLVFVGVRVGLRGWVKGLGGGVEVRVRAGVGLGSGWGLV